MWGVTAFKAACWKTIRKDTDRHTENMECWLLTDYICEQWKSHAEDTKLTLFCLTSDHITTPKLYVFPIFFPNNPYFPSLHVTRIFSVKRPQIYFDPTLWRGGQLMGRCTTSIAHILLHKIQNPYLGKYQGLKKHNSIFCMEFSITGGGGGTIFHNFP